MPTTFTYRDGTTVDIPEGSEVERDDSGEILYWRLPPITPDGELHPDQVPGYVPKFDPVGPERRVLMFITDEDHVGRGPRNTVSRLVQELGEDPLEPRVEDVEACLGALTDAGLVKRHKDGTVVVTAAGRRELAN